MPKALTKTQLISKVSTSLKLSKTTVARVIDKARDLQEAQVRDGFVLLVAEGGFGADNGFTAGSPKAEGGVVVGNGFTVVLPKAESGSIAGNGFTVIPCKTKSSGGTEVGNGFTVPGVGKLVLDNSKARTKRAVKFRTLKITKNTLLVRWRPCS
jgi:hypothetical protein